MKTTLLSAAALVSLMTAGTAQAATSQRVMFESNGERLVGDLYLPDDYAKGQKLPAIIVTGAWTTVKEQMPATYAAQMADKGFAALTFDFRNWGQSEGIQRQLESPELKTQDIVAAAQFLTTLPIVDAQRIGGLGICASSGYMVDATIRSSNIRSVALVAPWLHNEPIVNDTYGGKEAVNSLITTGREAEQVFATNGSLITVPAASATDQTAIMFQAPYYTEPDRGLIPEYVNEFNLASWESWLTYDAISLADDLGDNSLLIVHSENAAIPQGAREFYANVRGQKNQLWLENVTQFDFYDDESAVTTSTNAVSIHFNETLK